MGGCISEVSGMFKCRELHIFGGKLKNRHCITDGHYKIKQKLKLSLNVTGKPTFFLFLLGELYIKNGCPQENHFLKRFLRPCPCC